MKRKRRSAKERERLLNHHGRCCHFCGLPIDPVREAWELSHDLPLELGGADDDANTKPAHRKCHRDHTAAVDQPRIAKAKRQRAAYVGTKSRRGPPMPGSRDSPWRRKFGGGWERR